MARDPYPPVNFILYDERAVPGSDTDDAQVLCVYDSVAEARREAREMRWHGHLYRVEKLSEVGPSGLPRYGNETYVERV